MERSYGTAFGERHSGCEYQDSAFDTIQKKAIDLGNACCKGFRGLLLPGNRFHFASRQGWHRSLPCRAWVQMGALSEMLSLVRFTAIVGQVQSYRWEGMHPLLRTCQPCCAGLGNCSGGLCVQSYQGKKKILS